MNNNKIFEPVNFKKFRDVPCSTRDTSNDKNDIVYNLLDNSLIISDNNDVNILHNNIQKNFDFITTKYPKILKHIHPDNNKFTKKLISDDTGIKDAMIMSFTTIIIMYYMMVLP